MNPSISANGRFVAFEHYTGVPDVGDLRDIMVRDLWKGTTRAITALSTSASAYYPVISDDGNRIAYLLAQPGSSTLVVHDRRTGRSTSEGVASSVVAPDISATGRYVVFTRQRIVGSGDDQRRLLDVYRRDVDRNRTILISTSPDGRPGNESSIDPTISADGRNVLFSSQASNLTDDGTGAQGGLYLRDVERRRTTVIPSPDGNTSRPAGYDPRLSPDGRFVLYQNAGIWVYDRGTGATRAASRPYSENYSINTISAISRYGRKVAFAVSYQVGGDLGDAFTPVIVRRVRTGQETVASVGPDGTLEPWTGSYLGGITPDGRYVTFYSNATNLVPEDGDSTLDVYVRDLPHGTTTLVSTTDAGGGC